MPIAKIKEARHLHIGVLGIHPAVDAVNVVDRAGPVADQKRTKIA